MHDIDRTQRELEHAMHEMQSEQFEFANEGELGELGEGESQELGEFGEYEGETGEGEWAGEYAGEAEGEGEWGELGESTLAGEGESHGEGEGEWELGEAETGEAQEMELASELLEVSTEAELDQFLGKLIKRVGRSVGKIVRSPIGRALGGVLKPFAKAVLPIAGTALGTFVGGPAGGAIGGKLASVAGRMFGLELEGLSAEDREFEVARRFVRYANATTRQALRAPQHANAQSVARISALRAARRFAPGVIPRRRSPSNLTLNVPGNGTALDPDNDAYSASASSPYGDTGKRGTWIRRGRRIILLGV